AATARAFRRAAAAFDPALLSGDDCAALAAELAATEKACGAARARAAARATACGAHRTQGFADPADWLARVSGSSRGEAQATIDTVATAAEACPRTNEALVSGALSLAQAREIVTTEAARPGSE